MFLCPRCLPSYSLTTVNRFALLFFTTVLSQDLCLYFKILFLGNDHSLSCPALVFSCPVCQTSHIWSPVPAPGTSGLNLSCSANCSDSWGETCLIFWSPKTKQDDIASNNHFRIQSSGPPSSSSLLGSTPLFLSGVECSFNSCFRVCT